MTDQELQQKRLVAAAIDIGVAVGIRVLFAVVAFGLTLVASGVSRGSTDFVGRLVALVGAVALLVYILGRDVFAGGRSFGKQIMGIRVVGAAGTPCTLVDSVQRNALFAVGSVVDVVASAFLLVPFIGCLVGCARIIPDIVAAVASLALVVIEIVKIVTEPNGTRLGDQIAKTRVIF